MANKRYKVNFRCPKSDCSSTLIEEVMECTYYGTRLAGLVNEINTSLLSSGCVDDKQYGRRYHYACRSCGYVLPGAKARCRNKTIDQFEWMKQHNMLEEIK